MIVYVFKRSLFFLPVRLNLVVSRVVLMLVFCVCVFRCQVRHDLDEVNDGVRVASV